MGIETFQSTIAVITDAIHGMPLDKALEAYLNQEFPANGEIFNEIREACVKGTEEGWLCQQEAGGIRFGRAVKPGQVTAGFSVDVVHMADIVGPHHSHPKGEIDMIMPLDTAARFDGHAEGWLVYPENSAHKPTVSDGAALILYLLPDGEIRFSR
ncbi:MAG: DUF4863 family protein [Gammaproteobacteria bacterium]|nr:DUF4863 family protein [Gammaproteobacteria bacterium]